MSCYIVGIDPGLTKDNPTGIVVYDSVEHKVVETAYYAADTRRSIWQRIDFIAQKVGEVLSLYGMLSRDREVRGVAIEMPWVGRNPQVALRLGILVGTLAHIARARGMSVLDIQPCEAKLVLTDHGRASKEMMIEAARTRFPCVEWCSHTADALAVVLRALEVLDGEEATALAREPRAKATRAKPGVGRPRRAGKARQGVDTQDQGSGGPQGPADQDRKARGRGRMSRKRGVGGPGRGGDMAAEPATGTDGTG